jgi:hypothetical protein
MDKGRSRPDEDDVLVWSRSVDGQFSMSNTYSLFFAANVRFPRANAIWKSKAIPRCKFFMLPGSRQPATLQMA